MRTALELSDIVNEASDANGLNVLYDKSRMSMPKSKAEMFLLNGTRKKSSHKDTDARWVNKNGVSIFGYKDHITTDAGTSLISDYCVTEASMYDSVALKERANESDSGKTLRTPDIMIFQFSTSQSDESVIENLPIF